MEYLDKALEQYGKTDMYPFHMPGHKRERLTFPDVYGIDITEIDGFDNLHHAQGILKEAQQRAAALYGSEQCYYLINGSTCGILAAICAAAPKGSSVLVARNSHKAVYHALYLRELRAEYLYPAAASCGILGQITPEDVEEAFARCPSAAAVILTSPTYEGVVSDIAGIAMVAHRHGKPLIVDSAHGAHLGLGGGFPEHAVRLGADAVIMSLHKTLPSFTQTALLHLCSDRIKKAEIEKFLGMFETSSPSYVLMAGMDACVRMVKEEGKQRFAQYRKRLDRFYESCRELQRLHVLTAEDLSEKEAFAWDDSKLVIFAGTTGLTGEELQERLRETYHLEMEMASGDYVLGMTSLMDRDEGFLRLAAALSEIDRAGSPGNVIKTATVSFVERMYQKKERRMEIYEALECASVETPPNEAAGKISAGYLSLYPPGIPMIVPGEVITEEFLGKLQECRAMGLEVQGAIVTVCRG